MRLTVTIRPGGFGLATGLAIFVQGMFGAPLAAQLDYSGSIQAASGRYIFAERSTGFSLSNGLLMRTGRFHGSFSIPLVLHNSTAVSYIAGIPVPTGGPEHGKVREQRGGGRGGQGGRSAVLPIGFDVVSDSGDVVDVTPPGDYEFDVGDPQFSAGIDLLEGTGLLRLVSLDASAKAPLAKLESGVGTGEWDFGLGASAVFGTGTTFLFADIGWWRVGDLPELELKDPLLFGLAVGRSFGYGRWSLLASWSGATRMIEGVDPEHALGLAGTYSTDSGRTVSAGLSAGLTESGSDFTAYVAWSIPLSLSLSPTSPSPSLPPSPSQ